MGCCCSKDKKTGRLNDAAQPWLKVKVQESIQPVPYLSKLEGHTIHSGQSIIIRGIVLKKSRFDINLCAGSRVDPSADQDDVILQLSNRVDDKSVILNSLKDQKWGPEAKFNCDFKAKKPFDYRLRIHDNHFQVFGNHTLLGTYEYRQPLESITHIYVTGDIELNNVSWEGKYYKLPYEAMIPGNFAVDRKLYVSGLPLPNSKGFDITLFAGADAAFHFNPRFDEKKVVRNTMVDEKWGKEERKGKFPFHEKKTFDVVLCCEADAFKCFINDKLFCSYKHRVAPAKIDKLKIDGNIDFQSVHLK